METVADIYCVGDLAKDLERWRPFVDVTGDGAFDPSWAPQLHNDRLLQNHQHQGRVVYEHALLLESVRDEKRWVTKPLLTYFKLIAEIEMRCIEVEICSFQLTANTIGIRCDGPFEELYAAATFAFACNLYLFDLACKHLNKKHGRGEILAEKPSRTDSRKRLAAQLDEQILAVHLMVKQILPRLQNAMVDGDAAGLAHRLKLLMRALDKVVVIL